MGLSLAVAGVVPTERGEHIVNVNATRAMASNRLIRLMSQGALFQIFVWAVFFIKIRTIGRRVLLDMFDGLKPVCRPSLHVTLVYLALLDSLGMVIQEYRTPYGREAGLN